MAIQDIWLSNLKSLVIQEGGGRKGLRAVADVAEVSEEYIYQLVNDKPTKAGKTRYPGKDIAEKIAVGFANGRPDTWFDSDLDQAINSIDDDVLRMQVANLAKLLEQIPQAVRQDAYEGALQVLINRLPPK